MFPASVSARSSRLSRRDPTSPFRHIDPIIIGCTVLLSIIGVVTVYSATRGPGPEYSNSYLYKQGRFGKFIGCSNFPTCKHVEPLSMPGVACPKCGGKLAEKRAKKGGRVFYGCVRYPDCDFTTWSRPLALPAPSGSSGLVVLAGKGRAKVLGSDYEFDLPEGFE